MFGIDQYTANNEFIKHWASVRSAANALHISKSCIIYCIQNSVITPGGGKFLWKYTQSKIN